MPSTDMTYTPRHRAHDETKTQGDLHHGRAVILFPADAWPGTYQHQGTSGYHLSQDSPPE